MDALFRALVQSGASDLHLRSGEPPMLRVHGELRREQQAALTPERLEAMLVSIMTPKELGEFRETGDTDWAYEIDGLARFRCNAGRDRFGPMGVFRVIPNQIRTADEMGLSREVQNLCYLTKGLVVVTGPTGSGKSTTLAGLVDLINRTRTDHIITIEDPIEFVHPSKKCLVTQRQVGLHTRSFKHALRAALREDPDIILVGEMRDLETVGAGLQAAETGHMVISTLHTTDVSETVNRVIDFFPPHMQTQIRVSLAGSLRGVVSQRLVPRADGRGLVPAIEVLVMNGRVRDLILNSEQTHLLYDLVGESRFYGMQTFDQALLDLYRSGMVTLDDALRSSTSPHDFQIALKQEGLQPVS
jgi:twitching motility protein PilT